MQVIFTPHALRQLERLYDYIDEQAGVARANGFVGRIIAYCEGFSTFPLRGTQRDDLIPGLRIIGFEYRVTIAFVVTPHAVLIEGIYYAGQNYEAGYR